MLTAPILFVIKKVLSRSKDKYLKSTLNKPEPFLRVRRGFEKLTNKFNLREAGFDYQEVDIDGVQGEFIVPKGVTSSAVILYLHGGGYHYGSINTSRSIASVLAKSCGTRALVINYRLSPEHQYPVPIEDTVKVYRYLCDDLNVQPASIAIGGDSAGGGLTVGTLMYLRDHNVTLPSCAVLLSPWADHTGTSQSFRTKDDVDPLLPASRMPLYSKSYLGDAPLDAKYASPVYHNLSGLPPMLIHVGEDEVLLDDSVNLAAKAKADGVKDVHLEIFPKHFHVFNLFHKVLPSARTANAKLATFILEHIAK